MTDSHVLHPHEWLTTPDGARVEIDTGMVPLIREVWRLGFATTGCCQNLGESVITDGEPGRERHARFYTGQAWLRMPLDDAQRLLGLVAEHEPWRERLVRWTHPDAWNAFVYLEPAGDGTAQLAPTAQILFPSRHLPALIELLRGVESA